MFTYFARLHEDSGLPVYPIAVLSYDSPLAPAESEYRVEFPGFDVLKFNFRVIQVNRLKWRDFLKHENPVAAALMSKMRMAKGEHAQVKYECLRLMLTLKLDPAKMQMIAGFVNTYLRLKPEEELWVESKIKKLDPTGEKIMQTLTYWEERGWQKGVQKGAQQAALAIAIRLLKRRFKKLSRAIERRVATLPVPRLEELCETVQDFPDFAEFQKWLVQHEVKVEPPSNGTSVKGKKSKSGQLSQN